VHRPQALKCTKTMKTGSAIKCLATKFMLECASNIIQFHPILKTLRNASLKRGQEIHFR
jgi:hypothetical protein